MNYLTAALGDVAPAKPTKINGYGKSDLIWQITLDHIESDTGRLLEKSIKPVSEAGTSTHGFDERHVLYSKLRPYLNKVLLPDEIGLGTTELVPMLPDPKRLDRVYLAHYLKSKAFVNWVSSQTAGAKMPRVSMQLFWEHQIPLPPLTEQKRIAAILDKADVIRRKRQQAIQLADDFLRAVFLDMFGDPMANPKGWPKGTFLDICQLNPRANKYDNNLVVSFVPMQDVSENSPYIQLKERRHYSEVKTGYTAFNEGDVLFAKITPCMENGKAGIAQGLENDVGFGSTEFHVFRPNRSEYAEFIYSIIHLESFRKLAASNFSGAVGHKRVPKDFLEKFPIYSPPHDLIKEYSDIFKRTQGFLKKLSKNEINMNDLFISLSQSAFSGKITNTSAA